MLEPTWGELIVSAVNSIAILIIVLKFLSKLPADNGHYPIEKVEWAKGAKHRKREAFDLAEDNRSPFDWFFKVEDLD